MINQIYSRARGEFKKKNKIKINKESNYHSSVRYSTDLANILCPKQKKHQVQKNWPRELPN